ncbi:MAG: hypothetical protein DWQ08_11695 [Proteobacteria bacterium]|nr:MAG: hypothetical protein DWQ08_11695 [Pseudomonadota bacterium]
MATNAVNRVQRGAILNLNSDSFSKLARFSGVSGFGIGLTTLFLSVGVALAQTDVGSLPSVSAPGAYGDTVTTGAAASASTQRALSPPPGIGADAAAGLQLSIGVGASRHSNPERLPQGSPEDTSYVINPSITWGGELGRHLFQIGYSAGSERFDRFDTEDSDYQSLNAALRLDITRILIADLYANHTEAEERRGASGSRVIGVNEDQDEYETDTLGGRVTLGRRTNLLQLYVGAETTSLDFTNNNQEFRDRDQDMVEAGLFFNVGPATALFLHASETDYDYLVGDPSNDNTETSLTAGVTWEATEALSLRLEAGNLEKDFDDPLIAGFDGDTYLGKLLWSPRDRTTLSLYASRTTEESADANAAFFVSEVTGVEFTQLIGERTTATLHYADANDEYSDGRIDDVTDYGIALGYNLFTWLDLGFSYNRVEKDSNDPDFDYEDDVYSLFVNFKPSLGGRN